MITYLQSKGEKVTIGGRRELFWSKSLGLGRYIWWQENPGSCKTHEKRDASRLKRDQDKPFIFAVCLPRA